MTDDPDAAAIAGATAGSWIERFIVWVPGIRDFSPATEKVYRASLRDFDRRMGNPDPDHEKVGPRRHRLHDFCERRGTALFALRYSVAR